MPQKESDLTIIVSGDLQSSDHVRVLDAGASRKITVAQFAAALNAPLVAEGFITSASYPTEFSEVLTKATDYTILNTNKTILVDASGGVINITLPTAASSWTAATNLSQIFYIKKITSDVNAVQVLTTGVDLIDGNTQYNIVGPGLGAIKVVTDGTNWFVF